MRPVIEDAFGCRVFEEYGTVENVLFASECEQGRLHVSPDCGIIEILRPDGSSCDSEEPGEVVATCLCRDFQPMVRFRLGDVAAWDSEPCPCSRHMPVLKEVCGRIEDVVVGPDGRETVRFHGLFTTVAGVREGQVIQEALDRIRVKVVPAPNYSVADAASITVAVKQRLGDEVSVVVEPVEALPRTTAGKVRAVVSLISKPSSNHTVASPDNDAEVERIQRVYSEYAKEGASNQRWSKDNAGNRAIVDERNKALLMALASSGYPPLDQLRILEIGCGRGDVLADLVKLGARPENIVGVDLLEDRIQDGKSAHPNLDLRQANATELPFPEGSFDLVLLYTVISSILDLKMATRVCKEAERVLRPGGAVAWYDMRRKNPSNPNIRPIEHSEIRSLFPDWSVNMRSLTVLPPLARKLGNSASWLYPALSAASMLHSHLFGLIIKPGGPLRTDGE
jgi:ubiquinone/menaquinone biosynthesis C-methylase UbiE